MKGKALKPVTLVGAGFLKRSSVDNRFQQLILLKALNITQDPKKLQHILNVKRVADVYKTLDKLALRREYHDALARHGISFDFLISGFKDVIEHGKDKDRVSALKAVMKSIGMDDYKEQAVASQGGWEEVLMKQIEEAKVKELGSGDPNEEYAVTQPEIPDHIKRRNELEDGESDVDPSLRALYGE